MKAPLHALALSSALLAPAAAQVPPERPDMAYTPPGAQAAGPGWSWAGDGFTIVQANVNAQGLNIVGDAANEPSIAIDPTAPNRIVIGWRQFDTIASNFRQAGYAWSNDGGRSWHFPGVITPGVFRSDPVLESDSAGVFYFYTLPSSNPGGWRCELFRSTDSGHTWTGPVLANGGDRAWMTIDKSGGIGDGNIYGIWNPAFGCCGSANFGRDLSGGLVPWPAAVTTSPTPIWGTVAAGPDGEVYIGGRSGTTPVIVRSDDARNPSATPTFPVSASVNLGGPIVTSVGVNPGGASGQVWIDVNRSTGPNRGHAYLLAIVNPSGTDIVDVYFNRSTDGGQTWGTPVRVNADPVSGTAIQWFPSMSVAPSGRIDVTYNSNHDTGSANLSVFYYTYSTDEGQSWSTPVALTPPWNSSVGYPQQNKIGDYYDQESDDVGVFVAMAATMNGEQDVYFIRINDWDCNRNGVPDTLDLAAGTLHDCDANAVPDECEIAAGAKPDVNGNGIPDGCECYADCNLDGVLDVSDFGCFTNRFIAGDGYADCNGDNVLDIADFGCFANAFIVGCP
jgi:hypothetical protein